MKKILIFCAFLAVLLLFTVGANAEDITSSADFYHADSKICDGDERTRLSYSDGDTLRISSDIPIESVYVKFDRVPKSWTLMANGSRISCGQNGFLHEYIDVADSVGAAKEVTLVFDSGAEVCDVFVFSAGELPEWVQCWSTADGDVDLLFLPTHADDDHLFFLGVLPYYAGELEYEVQVVYFVNHWNDRRRTHEMLNGLWTVGVRRYPVMGELPDAWDGTSSTCEYAYSVAEKNGLSRDALIEFQVEMLRRFRPLVVIGHDINGEYGHPQHMINTDTLIAALTLAADASYCPDTVSKYGVWDVPKTYLHLYGENKITMNWDIPLSRFGGMTAYEVSKLGYACHLSQQYTWFTKWLKGSGDSYTSATQIKSYKPTEYGLYRTTVGCDTVGGDFFENLTVRSKLPPDTDTETVPVTEPETMPVTYPETEPVTEPETKTETETITDTDTISDDTSLILPETDAPGNTVSKSTVYIIVLVVFATVMITLTVVLAKKENK